MKVALLVMPFHYPFLSSIGLTQIKDRIKSRFKGSIDVRVFYINLEFFEFFGHEAYLKIMADSSYTGVNDWLFRQEAFDNIADNREDYFARFYQGTMDNILGAESDKKWKSLGGFINEVIEKYQLTGFDLVGINATFSLVPALAFFRHLKKKRNQIITVVGGAGVYKEMGEALSRCYPYVDYVCSGSGLVSFPRLIEAVMKKDEQSKESIAGIFTKNNLGKVGNVSEELDISEDIYLDYHDFLESLKAFNIVGKDSQPMILLETSRGCYWQKCKFCGLNEDQLKYRVKDPARAIEEINRCIKEYDDCSLEMVDNVLPKNYLKKVLPYIRMPEGRRIMYEVRADYTEEEIKVLSQAGVRYVQPGIESLVTGIHEEMNKGINAIQCITMLKLCLKHGIFPGWNIIVGFPNITREMYENLIATMQRLTHLMPPTSLTPVRFDRYSHYWCEKEKYQLDLFPFSAYEYIYPYDDRFLFGIAYYFEDRNYISERFQLLGEYYTGVEKVITHWRARWKNAVDSDIPSLDFHIGILP
ncbi:MAG: RiPP maturation radical SAM protein 1 [Candidatus Aminicenantes bacterium]|nr:RiPP maturation radical SAM protein 1 [Candidatus Aminicenantes bacterium]NIM82461.1 RiPP maturation radical SAM protein 1 [Candidatus Aminicenantes bacterium]NIN21822.1 RiPP maturation radical SAM protein 1 [Candidatus Aminicenantes bacterium]NIN45614.1 RiPP maturation radical SAM protein 1 [Candidatus Aminicenantes bacterium]NIN88445.1 RiPP maturation radical SAM protein 1 [Candidatus Aminicenantes bacterium]